MRGALATMRLLGHLYLRKCVGLKLIAQVVNELIGREGSDVVPPNCDLQISIQLVFELLGLIGADLESTVNGRCLMRRFLWRVVALKPDHPDVKGIVRESTVRRSRGLRRSRIGGLLTDM